MEDCKIDRNMDICIYSIIIPHKDQPDLLRICLNSIPKCSCFEVIVIDDASAKEFYVDLKNIESDFPEVKFFFNEVSHNAGFCRNIGLSAATGKWIIFADSDDFFVDGCKECIQKYKNSPSQIVYFHTTSVFIGTKQLATRHLYTNKILDFYESANIDKEIMIKCLLLGPCSKMFKRSFLIENCILFDEIPVANDTVFALKAALLSSSIEVSESIIYCITSSLSSTMYRNSFDLLKVRLDVYMRANRLYMQYNKNRYKFNPVPLVLSARKYGYGKLVETLILERKYFPNTIIFLCSFAKDFIFWLWGHFLRKWGFSNVILFRV